jgi:hypothetical protein
MCKIVLENKGKDSSWTPIILQSSLFGVLRSLAGLPLEHPFDVIKTKM